MVRIHKTFLEASNWYVTIARRAMHKSSLAIARPSEGFHQLNLFDNECPLRGIKPPQ